MATPANSTPYAVYGQAFNLSAAMLVYATGNPLGTGLASLAAQISKDDGTFVSTTNAPTEIATNSGIVTLDLTAAEMTASKVIVKITATGVVTACIEVNPLDLRGTYTTLYNAQSVLRFEQMLKNVEQFLLNRNVNNGAQQIMYNDAGLQMASGVVTEADNFAERSQMA